MMTLKLRSPKESDAFWVLSDGTSYPSHSVLQGEAKKAVEAELLKPTHRRTGSYQYISDATTTYMVAQNSWMTDKVAEDVASNMASTLRSGEVHLFSRYVLNEFLTQQDGSLNYGEFVTANWDRIIRAMYKSEVVHGPNTKYIFSYALHDEAVILIRPNARKDTADAIYELTLDNVRTLLGMNRYKELVAKSGAVRPRIAALLAKARGESDKLPTRDSVTNTLNKAFIKSFAQETEKNFDHLEDANIAYSKELRGVRRRLFEDATHIETGQTSTAVAAPVAQWLSEYAPKLRFYELFALVHAMHNPPALVKLISGKSGSALTVMEAAIKHDPVEALASMKLFAEIIVSLYVELPTIEQWVAGIEDDTVRNSITSEITVTLLSGSGKEVKITPDLATVRRSILFFQNV